ncbi:MAG: hypothetical protein LAT54_04820 [Cryomorphaceae bacterium]|nr:hypothetical protein [Cryomorphaceae bacterium]
MKRLIFSLILMVNQALMFAQDPPVIRDTETPIVEPLELSGPRLGMVYIHTADFSNVYEISNHFSKDNPVPSFLNTIGWQFEKEYFSTPNGVAGLVEFIPMITGYNAGLFIPSANLLFGVRNSEGLEFGMGANVSLLGSSVIYAAGYTFKFDYLNIPVNFAFAQGRSTERFILTFGFNLRRHGR